MVKDTGVSYTVGTLTYREKLMTTFTKIKANARSLYMRKPIYGVGTNDAWYMTQGKFGGKQLKCPVYRKWVGMLERCYCPKFLKTRPTYAGCTVVPEWLNFSVFAKWFEANNIEGYHLDKDLKVKGNKQYGPDTCLLVPVQLNNLLTNTRTTSIYPVGVSLHSGGKYQAHINVNGKLKHLGTFETVELAQQAYAKGRNTQIRAKAREYPQYEKYLIQHLLTED